MEGIILKDINKIKENIICSKEQLTNVLADVAWMTSDNPELNVIYDALHKLEESLTYTEKSLYVLKSNVQSLDSAMSVVEQYLR